MMEKAQKTRSTRKSKRANTVIGVCLIGFGVFLLWWMVFTSNLHAVPTIVGFIVMIVGVLSLKGVWDSPPSHGKSSTAVSKKKTHGKVKKRKKHKDL